MSNVQMPLSSKQSDDIRECQRLQALVKPPMNVANITETYRENGTHPFSPHTALPMLIETRCQALIDVVRPAAVELAVT